MNYEYLRELIENNDCFLSTTSFFEIIFQCRIRNCKNWIEEFVEYFDFAHSFRNENCVINEVYHMNFYKYLVADKKNLGLNEEILNKMLEDKAETEKNILFLIYKILESYVEKEVREYLGRTLNEQIYGEYLKNLNDSILANISDICSKKYSFNVDSSIDNDEFDKLLNSILFESIYENLLFLCENYSISHKKLEYIKSNHPFIFEKFTNKFSKHIYSSINQLQTEWIDEWDNDWNDIIRCLDKINFKSVPDSDKGMAFFVRIRNSPDYVNVIKPNNKSFNNAFHYIKQILRTLENQTKIKKIKKISNEIREAFKYPQLSKFEDEDIRYFTFLIISAIENERYIRKNDISDYYIATIINKFGSHNEWKKYSKEKSIVLTCDKNMKSFLKSETKFYDEKIYSKIGLI